MATTAAAVIACAAGASYVYEQPKPGYIAGWVEPDSPTGSGTNYKTLAEAMVKCDEYASSFGECKVSGGNAGTPGSGCICHGITLQNGDYQLRASETINPNTASGEQSWLRTAMRCESNWGSSFLLVALCVSTVYVGGGRLYHQRHGRSEWPHAANWAELRSLVLDGATFARARVQGKRAPRQRGDSKSHLEHRIVAGHAQRDQTEQQLEKPTRDRSPRKKDSDRRRQMQQPEDEPADVNASLDPPQLSHPSQTPPSGARAVASAGGGRWVHVPT